MNETKTANCTERRCVHAMIYITFIDFDVSCEALIFSNPVGANGLVVTSNSLLLCGWSLVYYKAVSNLSFE